MDRLEQIMSMLEECSPEERHRALAWLRKRQPIHPIEEEFGTTAEVILEAIARASDLSQRGVLGLIAEASFQVNVVDPLIQAGWTDEPPSVNAPFDFRIRRDGRTISIQVKRQRLAAGKPKCYGRTSLYVAETQRSRTGRDKTTGENTRPYRFGEFDILAVCMQPVTGDWTTFRYTPQRWLLARPENAALLQVLQPVSLEPNDDWCDDLNVCIDWLVGGEQKRIRES